MVGWVGEKEAVRMRYCELGLGGWEEEEEEETGDSHHSPHPNHHVGGWVGGVFLPVCQMWEMVVRWPVGGWVGGWVGGLPVRWTARAMDHRMLVLLTRALV